MSTMRPTNEIIRILKYVYQLIKKIKYDFNDRGFRNMLRNGRNDSNILTKEPTAFNLCYQSK